MPATIPGRNAQRREPRMLRATHFTPGQTSKGPFASGITTRRYRQLSDVECLMLALCDSYGVVDGGDLVEIDYDELIDVANRMKGLKDSCHLLILSDLRNHRVLDYNLTLDDERTTITITPWKKRRLLAENLSDEMTRRELRRNELRRASQGTDAA